MICFNLFPFIAAKVPKWWLRLLLIFLELPFVFPSYWFLRRCTVLVRLPLLNASAFGFYVGNDKERCVDDDSGIFHPNPLSTSSSAVQLSTITNAVTFSFFTLSPCPSRVTSLTCSVTGCFPLMPIYLESIAVCGRMRKWWPGGPGSNNKYNFIRLSD